MEVISKCSGLLLETDRSTLTRRTREGSNEETKQEEGGFVGAKRLLSSMAIGKCGASKSSFWHGNSREIGRWILDRQICRRLPVGGSGTWYFWRYVVLLAVRGTTT